MNYEALFSAELRDCDLINRIEEQPAVTREELSDAQSEWEAEQYEAEMAEISDAQWEAFQADHEAEYEWTEEAIAWEEGMHPDNLYDGEPVMDLPNDLYMVFDDPDYWG